MPLCVPLTCHIEVTLAYSFNTSESFMTTFPSSLKLLRHCQPSNPKTQVAFAFPRCSLRNFEKHQHSSIPHSLPVSSRTPRSRQHPPRRTPVTNSASAKMTTKCVDEDPHVSNSEEPRLYFCYGSNMVRDKLRSRGMTSQPPITFTEVWTARLPDWQLCFNLRGAPPREPAMGSIRQQPGEEVYGLVYRIGSDACWQKLLASEGVTEHHGAYDSYHVVPVEVECFKAETPSEKRKIWVKTLVTNPRFCLPVRWQDVVLPSQRYMNLLIDGARQERLPPKYIQRLEAAPVARVWQPSILLSLMVLTLPLAFLARRKKMRYLMYPLSGPAMVLYVIHERLALHSKRSSLLRKVGLLLCRIGLFLLYSLYAIPAGLVVTFDPRGRRVYSLLRNRNTPKVQERPTQSTSQA